jgi:hypothetical protein
MNMRIGIYASFYIPEATDCAFNAICPRRGSLIDAINIICKSFPLNCSFVFGNESKFGTVYENGTVTGLVKAIQEGLFDTTFPVFATTYDRFKAVSFSHTFDVADIVAVTRAPETVETKIFQWHVVTSFHFTVWLALLSTIIFISSLIFVFDKIFELQYSIFEILRLIIMSNFTTKLLRLYSFRIIATWWILIMLVLNSAYTGVLFSKAVAQKDHLPFKDVESFVDCLERKNCRIVSYSTSISYLERVAAANSSLNFRFLAAIDKNPLKIVPIENIVDEIEKEKSHYLVSIGPKSTRLSWMRGNLGCKFHMIDIGINEFRTFPVAKNSSLLPILEKAALYFREFGLVDALNRKYDSSDLCEKKPKRKFESVQFWGFISTAFCFYGIGIVICVVCFIVEMDACKKRGSVTFEHATVLRHCTELTY